jgi:hypothetical protein
MGANSQSHGLGILTCRSDKHEHYGTCDPNSELAHIEPHSIVKPCGQLDYWETETLIGMRRHRMALWHLSFLCRGSRATVASADS